MFNNRVKVVAGIACLMTGGFAACGIEKPDAVEDTAVAQAAIKAAFGDVENDVNQVRFDLFACPSAKEPDLDKDGVPDGATPSQSVTSPMGPGFLPGNLATFEDNPLDSKSKHRYSDGLFVVPANECRVVRSTPLIDSETPSADCYPAAKTIPGVPAGKTAEVVILNQCKGAPKAVIDAVAALNHPPELLDIAFTKDGQPATKFTSCDEVRVCTTVLDPDNDPLLWSLTAPPEVTLIQAKDYPKSEGKGVSVNCWDLKASKEGSYELSLVVKDEVWDRMADPKNPKLISIEDFIQAYQHETYHSRAEQTFPTHALECNCDVGVEVVFAMDTSGSMNDEAVSLCNSISAVQAKLAMAGITAKTRLLGIDGPIGGPTFSCLTDTVRNVLGSTVPGNGGLCGNTLVDTESWGQASALIAQKYPWTPGYLRLVVPLSDEGACHGDPCVDPGQDRDSVQNAIAQHGSAIVSPILGTPGDPNQRACIAKLAKDLASGTGGVEFETNDPIDLPTYIENVVLRACKR